MNSRPKRVLITGGADGLGKEICLKYLSMDAEITVLDIDREKGEQLASEHSRISFVPCDLSSFEGTDKLSGEFDTVICNAGISACGNFRDTPWETENKIMEVNLFGHMRLIKALLQEQQITTGGRLAFTLSASVFTPFPLAVAYASSKAAMEGFANALEPYLIPKKITISRIYPGTMRTAHQQKYYAEMNPSTGTNPESIAKKVVRGIERRKRRIYPDKMGWSFRMISRILPWAMPGLAFKATKRYRDILYPDKSTNSES